MATRSNACSELTRFWLEARHGCLVTEGVPVPVPYGISDIDFVAMQPASGQIMLPNGSRIGPRFIVEAKDEHDFDPAGKEFAKMFLTDLASFGDSPCIPRAIKSVKFTMLREQHYQRGKEIFGSEDFDRLFVVHAMDMTALDRYLPELESRRIHLLTIRELVRDLRDWYPEHSKPSGPRHTLIGDLWHLLAGYCKMDLPAGPTL